MKKYLKVLLISLLIIPFYVKAENENCDYSKHKIGIQVAKHVQYTRNYDEKTNTFELEISNIDDDMYVKYDEKKLTVNNKTAVIKNLKEGKKFRVNVYYKDGCETPVDMYAVTIPYVNDYYGSALCKDYKDKLYVCNAKYTSYKVTREIVEGAINNYSTVIPVEEPEPEEPDDPTYLEIFDTFVNTWGLKIALFLSSGTITYIICNSRLRKETHGI